MSTLRLVAGLACAGFAATLAGHDETSAAE
jgi:hypothetical protein